jgi:alcohol dehydrogenase class IV
VDPNLAASMTREVTAATGLDALTQLLEAFVGRKANPLTDGLCREGLSRAAYSLERAWADGGDMAARTDMSLAALLGGMALANAGLGAVHGFAGPLGGMIEAPHGVICARLLPHVVAANVAALRNRGPAVAIERFDELARLLTGCQEARAQDAVVWIRSLCDRLEVPPLRSFGWRPERIPEAVAKAQRASSMKGNPLDLAESELTAILEAAL